MEYTLCCGPTDDEGMSPSAAARKRRQERLASSQDSAASVTGGVRVQTKPFRKTGSRDSKKLRRKKSKDSSASRQNKKSNKKKNRTDQLLSDMEQSSSSGESSCSESESSDSEEDDDDEDDDFESDEDEAFDELSGYRQPRRSRRSRSRSRRKKKDDGNYVITKDADVLIRVVSTREEDLYDKVDDDNRSSSNQLDVEAVAVDKTPSMYQKKHNHNHHTNGKNKIHSQKVTQASKSSDASARDKEQLQQVIPNNPSMLSNRSSASKKSTDSRRFNRNIDKRNHATINNEKLENEVPSQQEQLRQRTRGLPEPQEEIPPPHHVQHTQESYLYDRQGNSLLYASDNSESAASYYFQQQSSSYQPSLPPQPDEETSLAEDSQKSNVKRVTEKLRQAVELSQNASILTDLQRDEDSLRKDPRLNDDQEEEEKKHDDHENRRPGPPTHIKTVGGSAGTGAQMIQPSMSVLSDGTSRQVAQRGRGVPKEQQQGIRSVKSRESVRSRSRSRGPTNQRRKSQSSLQDMAAGPQETRGERIDAGQEKNSNANTPSATPAKAKPDESYLETKAVPTKRFGVFRRKDKDAKDEDNHNNNPPPTDKPSSASSFSTSLNAATVAPRADDGTSVPSNPQKPTPMSTAAGINPASPKAQRPLSPTRSSTIDFTPISPRSHTPATPTRASTEVVAMMSPQPSTTRRPKQPQPEPLQEPTTPTPGEETMVLSHTMPPTNRKNKKKGGWFQRNKENNSKDKPIKTKNKKDTKKNRDKSKRKLNQSAASKRETLSLQQPVKQESELDKTVDETPPSTPENKKTVEGQRRSRSKSASGVRRRSKSASGRGRGLKGMFGGSRSSRRVGEADAVPQEVDTAMAMVELSEHELEAEPKSPSSPRAPISVTPKEKMEPEHEGMEKETKAEALPKEYEDLHVGDQDEELCAVEVVAFPGPTPQSRNLIKKKQPTPSTVPMTKLDDGDADVSTPFLALPRVQTLQKKQTSNSKSNSLGLGRLRSKAGERQGQPVAQSSKPNKTESTPRTSNGGGLPPKSRTNPSRPPLPKDAPRPTSPPAARNKSGNSKGNTMELVKTDAVEMVHGDGSVTSSKKSQDDLAKRIQHIRIGSHNDISEVSPQTASIMDDDSCSSSSSSSISGHSGMSSHTPSRNVRPRRPPPTKDFYNSNNTPNKTRKSQYENDEGVMSGGSSDEDSVISAPVDPSNFFGTFQCDDSRRSYHS